MIGAGLGSYTVTAKLGEGGMGEVWRAEDTKLGREVALKVLPAEFADDEERLSRFEREAKVLASLNHPNIAHLYGLETATPSSASASAPAPASDRSGKDGDADADVGPFTFLVMELVEGDGLDEMIARGPVPVEDAIPIALQIAEALEAAHEAGIVHRDLKPANVKIRSDGTVKVLDFGLAKAWDEGDATELSLSPTLTRHATAAGVILGTAAYMSPEQARGKPVDRRADIWAYGVVLWEMLTGRKLFGGDTVTDVLASVLKEAPDLEALPADTPVALRRLVARCLEHDPRQRLQWIGDARLELTEAADGGVPTAATVGLQAAAPRWRERLAWAAAVVLLIATAWLALRPSPSRPEPSLTRFTVTLDEGRSLSVLDLPVLDLSPDGRTIAFVASDPESPREMIFVRRLDDARPQPVPGTEGATAPFFSPDGSWLGFFVDGELRKVALAGGSPATLASTPNTRGGAWLADDTIVYSPEYSAGLLRVPANGGAPTPLVELDEEAGERTYRYPDALPGGDAVLFTVGMMDSPNHYDDARIDVFEPSTGRRRTIIEGANMARWIDPRRLIFARAGTLYAVGFDPERLETVGPTVPVMEDVGGEPSSGAAHFAVAENGTVIWATGALTESSAMLTIVDREGVATRLPLEQRGFYQPRFSPDGTRLAVTVGRGATGLDGDIWIYSLSSGTFSRLTFDDSGLKPVWAPGGNRLAYLDYENRPTIVIRSADGRGGTQLLVEGDLAPLLPESFSPDGRRLTYIELGKSSDVFVVTDGGEPELFERRASSAVFSPDGRWIAYASPGSGSSRVFVRAVDGNGKWQVSPGLGGYPRWSGDGRKLFYIQLQTADRPLMEVDVEDSDGFRISPPRTVIPSLAGRFVTSTAPVNNWDVAPDGNRFVFVELERDERALGRIEVATGWAATLPVERP